MQQKKISLRKCILCNEQYPKKELLRIVRTPDGAVMLDLVGKKSGRGAYICKKPSCISSAKKTKRLQKALDIAIPDELYTEIESILDE